mgnify:CR=1 FL=1
MIAATERARLHWAALASTALFAGLLAAQIARRGGLGHDELHSLLLARLLRAGEALPFHVGSVTRYEGGSWLIAWPVSWALALGVPQELAPPMAAAGVACVGVLGGSIWLGRAAGWRSALALGPLAALAAPELAWYAQRAWGSLAEGLALLPWLALGLERWRRRPTTLRSAALGIALGLAAVVSYLHAITALTGAALLLAWRRPRHLAIASATAAGAFGVWLALAVPFWEEALFVRGGRGLHQLLPHLLLPRLDRVVSVLPSALAGPGRQGLLTTTAGLGLGALFAAALVRAWRQGGSLRWLPAFALVSLAALSAGTTLAPPDEAHRYTLPLLAVAVAALAAWPRARLLGAFLALPLWLPPPEAPGQPPHAVHAQLGANAQQRVDADPHRKIKALWRVTEPWARPWLVTGYGLDQGRRHRGVVRGMNERLQELGGDRAALAGNPHFAHLDPASWVVWTRPLPNAEEREAYLFGFGRGLGEDGRDPEDEALFAVLRPDELEALLGGYGAGLVRSGAGELASGPERRGACVAGQDAACEGEPSARWRGWLSVELPRGR